MARPRPARLDEVPAVRAGERREVSPARALARNGVSGTHRRYRDGDVRALVRRVAAGDREVLLGLDPLHGLTPDDAVAAVSRVWGWPKQEIVASTAPEQTLDGMRRLVERVDGVAAAGGTIAFASARPASLLALSSALADRARRRGARVPDEGDTPEFLSDGRRGRRLRWVGGVAVLTDGAALVPTSGIEAGEELLFAIPRPDLLVGDHGFVSAAWRIGVEVAAFIDFDAVALAVTGADDPRCTFVPLDDDRAPRDYEPLLAMVRPPS